MGNTVASEGEDMADSPRVATGEISQQKRKHRSFRKRLTDKFKKANADKEYKEDLTETDQKNIKKETEVPQEGANRRRKLYKNLGISKAGSREEPLSNTSRPTHTADYPLGQS